MSLHYRSTAATRAAATRQTFDEFFTESWPWAYRLACFMTQDRSAGEEIAQDTLAKVCQRWGSLDRPEAYLRTSLVNTCRNWHRTNKTQQAKLPLVAVSDRVDFAADDLADAIARLPFRQRAVIVLRYYADLPEREIAEAIGCRPGTVKSLASRALRSLSKEVPK